MNFENSLMFLNESARAIFYNDLCNLLSNENGGYNANGDYNGDGNYKVLMMVISGDS